MKSRRVWMIAALLFVGTIALYWPATRFDFVNYDDPDYVWFNPNVQKGLQPETVTWALTYAYAGNWHPVTWMSHMVDCSVFGLKAGGHHLTNVLLHAANTTLVFLVLLKLLNIGKTPNTKHQAPEKHQDPASKRKSAKKLQTGSGASDEPATFNLQPATFPAASRSTPHASPGLWCAAIIAALFAVHPLHVESVAWISERKDVLSGFFFLLTIWAYARYARGHEDVNAESAKTAEKRREGPVAGAGLFLQSSRFEVRGSRFFFRTSIFLYALALMSKPMVVTLPFVLLLLDFWPLKRFQRSTINNPLSTRPWQLLREKAPFFAIAALDCWLTLKAQAGGNAVARLSALPISERVLNVCESYWFYLSKFFVPGKLAVFYPYTPPHGVSAVAAGLLILSVCVLTVWQLPARPYLFVGWFWFLGTLVPVIGLVQVGIQKYADRYMYLPMMGLLIACVFGLWEFVRNFAKMLGPLWIAGAVTVAALAVAAHAQLRYWRDGVTLFSRALAVTAPNALSEFSLAQALEEKGRTEEAEVHYRRAIKIPPVGLGQERTWQFRSRLSLASRLVDEQKWPEAEQQLRVVVRERPNEWWQAHFYLAECLAALGRYEEAETSYRQALRLEEHIPDGWRQLGLVLAREGKSSEAVGDLGMALQLRPDGAQELSALAWVLATDPNSAVRDGQKALSLAVRACDITQMKSAQCLATLDAAYAETGDFDRAIITAGQTRSVALKAGKSDIAVAAEQRIELYRSGKAYRAAPKQGT